MASLSGKGSIGKPNLTVAGGIVTAAQVTTTMYGGQVIAKDETGKVTAIALTKKHKEAQLSGYGSAPELGSSVSGGNFSGKVIESSSVATGEDFEKFSCTAKSLA